jgi:hypothetical protein
VRITRLRAWRNGADFDMTEAHTHHPGNTFGILVEPGRKPNRIRKMQPRNISF